MTACCLHWVRIPTEHTGPVHVDGDMVEYIDQVPFAVAITPEQACGFSRRWISDGDPIYEDIKAKVTVDHRLTQLSYSKKQAAKALGVSSAGMLVVMVAVLRRASGSGWAARPLPLRYTAPRGRVMRGD